MIKYSLSVFFLISLLFLSSCKSTARYVIPNASLPEVSQLFKEFVGLNGFQFTYRLETPERMTYRIYAGTSVDSVSGQSETTYPETSSRLNLSDTPNRYSDSIKNVQGSIRSSSRPATEVSTDWNFSIQMIQQGNNIFLYTSSDGGFNPGQYVKQFVKYLSYHGYTISVIKE